MVQKGNPTRSTVNLNDVIAYVLRLVHSDALERHCALVTQADPNLPLVEGDQVQLQQVVLNLIMNGIESLTQITDRPRTLNIRSKILDPGSVIVSVQDAGAGLDPRSAGRIFENFFTTKTNGLGMGLAISRSIIEAHGGRLWATANAQRGATFHFTLPAEAHT